MPVLGSVEPFDPNDQFDCYLERVEHYFVANAIGEFSPEAHESVRNDAARKKLAIFLTLIGKETYKVTQTLCSPRTPGQFSYEEIVDILKKHFNPVKLQIAESFKFRKCVQKDGESISDYVSRLRRCASTCNYKEFLDRALKEQFTVGLRCRESQLRLLSKEHTLEESIQQAIADEAAVRESAHFVTNHHNGSNNINFLQRQQSVQQKKADRRYRPKNFDFKSNSVVSSSSSKTNTSNYTCYSCGKSGHLRIKCKFRDAVCHKCSQKGHIASVCKSSKTVHHVEEIPNPELYNISTSSSEGLLVTMNVEGKDVRFQIDTGCGVSLVPFSVYKQFSDKVTLQSCDMKLRTYTGEVIKPYGKCDVNVLYEGKSITMPLVIVNTSENIPLLGRNWLHIVRLNWPALSQSSEVNFVASPDLFGGLGCYTGDPIKLTVDEEPKFHRARKVPYAIQHKVEEALKKMESDGILRKVQTASCAAPIVPIEKKSGGMRICGDFRVTYNKCSSPAVYPIPRIDDLHASLRGCTVFSTLDMSQAYHQLPIHPDSQKWLTINTHLGLYTFLRCPNGIHTAPALFQEIMDKTLAGVPHTIAYLDDILVAGIDQADHDSNLRDVFNRLRSSGFTLNRSKCAFNKSSVTYLAHRIDSEGLHPTEDKLRAVSDAPTPHDAKSLRSFLGLIMFYSKFLANHSNVLAPLNKLLCKDEPWCWTQIHDEAFSDAKKLLIDSQTLVHYDDTLPLYMSCDASAYGCGGVLFHRINGNDRPVAFASCSLTKSQKNYSQLDKEAFAIIFCLKRFHQFLYGRAFHIITDHKPLLQLLGEGKPVPVHTAARLQRYSLILASYKYKLLFRPTRQHIDADAMSRLPMRDTFDPTSDNVNCNFFDTTSNVSALLIKKSTLRDPLLSKVYNYTIGGWPTTTGPSLSAFRMRKDELSVDCGCLLWGQRVIIPPNLRKPILDELHVAHPGMTRMKALARSYVWWPNMDEAIEELVQECNVCQTMRNHPAKAPYHPWVFPSSPWNRIHIDFLGPVNGHMYFVLVDAYSKFPEVVKMKSITTSSTIRALRDIFSRHGLPKSIISDNGPQFTSSEFKTFCDNNGIAHITTAVYKPSTNGQCERVVQIVKSALKQARLTGDDPDVSLPTFLLRYRITPHSTTGETPAMLLYGRQLRTRLDMIRPSVSDKVSQKQQHIMDKSTNSCRLLQVGDKVRTRSFSVQGARWIDGEISIVLGNRHYIVKVGTQSWKRHIDQIIKSSVSTTCSVSRDQIDTEIPIVPPTNCEMAVPMPNNSTSPEPTSQVAPPSSCATQSVHVSSPVISDTGPRRSTRVRKPPSRYEDFTT